MKQIIGFGTQFYTLWNYETENQYRADAYGKKHQIGILHNFYYLKNISKDLVKVKELYPNVQIDEQLRGKTSSFSWEESLGLPEGYFWFGKHIGELINKVIESDFEYCLWYAENYNNTTSKSIEENPKYISFLDSKNQEKIDLLASAKLLKVGDLVQLEFLTNGYNANKKLTECWIMASYEGFTVRAVTNGVKKVNGLYPYLMPIINGRAVKTKNKTIEVEVIEVISTTADFNEIQQLVKIK
jgi:hypothetical protein